MPPAIAAEFAQRTWDAYARRTEVPEIAVRLNRMVHVRSDPLDGSWITVVAEVQLGDVVSRGYATGQRATAELRWRAVGEAVERAVWQSRAADSADPVGWAGAEPVASTVPVECTSAGSAVHQSAGAAVLAGAREVVERICFLAGFHSRQLGVSLPVPERLPGLRDVSVRAWYDGRSRLVSVAAYGPDAVPRLGMAAALAATSRDAALLHCLSELAQVRPWVRRRRDAVVRPPRSDDVRDPGSRADYWASCTDAEARTIFDELAAGSDPPRWPVPSPADLTLTAAARVVVNDTAHLWYARTAAPGHAYQLHSFDAERACFEGMSDRPLSPHPLI